MTTPSVMTVSARAMGAINWVGMRTLIRREVWRFIKVWNQTILAPVVTTLLFLAVLTLALGGAERTEHGLPYGQFVAPGLIMMAIVQNAFANTSSSLILSKVQGVIIDVLMPPFKGWEITTCLAIGGMVRGLCVGISVSTAMALMVPMSVHSVPMAIAYAALSGLMLALLGILGGIWAQTFDQMAAVTNYIITPLSFLSGTFYSIQHLPPVWQAVSHYNPFFYMIDGFRYALTGYSDGNPALGLVILLATNPVLYTVACVLFSRGTRLRG
jgi:ABC-2 type transport system permease protein